MGIGFYKIESVPDISLDWSVFEEKNTPVQEDVWDTLHFKCTIGLQNTNFDFCYHPSYYLLVVSPTRTLKRGSMMIIACMGACLGRPAARGFLLLYRMYAVQFSTIQRTWCSRIQLRCDTTELVNFRNF